MNVYLLSVVLGVIEGLTEFLPVSSTAHLRIAESLLHINLADGYWKMYTIVIQLGAILCLPIYFRSRIAKFLSTFPLGENGDRNALVKLRWGLSSCAGDGVPLRDITVERDISRHHAREGEVLLDVLTYRCG